MLTPEQLTGKKKEAYEAQIKHAKKIFPVGVHDISNEDYHSSAGISKSGLLLFKKPRKYWHKYLNPNAKPIKKKKSFELGNAVHTYLLEPKLYNKHYKIMPKFTGKGSVAKKLEFREANKKKVLIRKVDSEIVKAATQAIAQHPKANNFFTANNRQIEKSFFWIDTDTGLLVKSRPDIIIDDWIIELKTTANSEEEVFSRDINRYGYHVQAAMAIEAQKQLFNKQINRFLFVACETEEPYITEVYALDDGSIDKGLDIYKTELIKAQTCFIEDDWLGESKNIRWIGIPHYAF